MDVRKKINVQKSYEIKLKLIKPRLTSFCYSRISNRSDADDVLQNCLLILFQKQSEYNPNKDFYAWAFRICSFQIKAYLSSLKRAKKNQENHLEHDSLGYAISTMPFQDLIEKEKREVFKEIRSLLSITEKNIIDLSLKGFSQNQIMKKLKISCNNYRTQKSRLIAKAKKYFKNKPIEDYKITYNEKIK